MKRGRRALPEAMKEMRGTSRPDRKRAKPALVGKLTAESIDAMPKYPQLTDRGMSIFRARAKQLSELDLCDLSFVDGLILYAQWYDVALRAAEEVNKSPLVESVTKPDGSMQRKMNESLKVLKMASDEVNRIGGEFGFSPISRQDIETKRPDVNPVDELERLSEVL